MPKLKFEGLERVVATLRRLAAESRAKDNASVSVGYVAAYALAVHENLEAHHQPGKQAKYLESPARQLSNDGTFSTLVYATYRKGHSMAESLLVCGLRLQRDSQEIVPVDTGNLKGGAFTALD